MPFLPRRLLHSFRSGRSGHQYIDIPLTDPSSVSSPSLVQDRGWPASRSSAPRIRELVSLIVLGVLVLSALYGFASGRIALLSPSDVSFGNVAGDSEMLGGTVNGAVSMLNGADLKSLNSYSFFQREAYPIRRVFDLWELAQGEIEAKGLDTCGDKLGKAFVEAHVRTAMSYCGHGDLKSSAATSSIVCTDPRKDPFTSWWPHPSSPCISTSLKPRLGTLTEFEGNCPLTSDGEGLLQSFTESGEEFLGRQLSQVQEDVVCESSDWSRRTGVFIRRQDQWNPFHVSEDLITTVTTLLIAGSLEPTLKDKKVQLVFADEYGLEGNHYYDLWDRIGAWPPRRLSLDPWREGECLGQAIHSVNAGASLLSAMEVNHAYPCASSISWGAAHFYRSLFGQMPASRSEESANTTPVNILFLSRSKYDAWSEKHDQWSSWKEWRHINNEKQIFERIREGLRDMCSDPDRRCSFSDPEDKDDFTNWSTPTDGVTRKIQFTSIDPSVHTFLTQVDLVGHSTILISPHSGALGLEFFLPPGQGHVIELQVPQTVGWHHYDIMSSELGHGYEMVIIARDVDTNSVWAALERALKRVLD